ncbi:MAG: O-antigen ligase family protein [Herpetosiphonaceae bacterium]|nr:O-antigen ligase family protein [Herpetosiphonaceae bacterium]
MGLGQGAGTSARQIVIAAGVALLLLALLLALLPLKLALALVGGLLFVAVTVIEPAWGLYGAVLSVPVQDLVVLPGGLTVTQVVVVLAAGAWALRVLAFPDKTLGLRWQWIWLVWLGWQLLTVVFTPYSLAQGLQQWARWVAAWLAFVLTLGTITTPKRAWGLVASLLIAPTVAALDGMWQFVTASGPPSFLIIGGRFARAAATFGKPNPFGGYMNMIWPLAAMLTLYFLRHARRSGQWQPRMLLLGTLCAGTTLALLGGLFASYSRGGWIGAIIGVFGMALLTGRRSAVLALSALLLALVIGLAGSFSILPAVVTDRLSSVTDYIRIFDAGEETVTSENFAIVERMAQMQAGWRMWQSSPLLGIGPGNYNSAYPDFYVGHWSESQGHAHNYYINTLAESGVPGLIVYLGLIGTMFAQGLRLRRMKRGSVWSAIALGGCGIMLAVAGHNLFENLHVLNLGIPLSAVWGLMVVGLRETEWR